MGWACKGFFICLKSDFSDFATNTEITCCYAVFAIKFEVKPLNCIIFAGLPIFQQNTFLIGQCIVNQSSQREPVCDSIGGIYLPRRLTAVDKRLANAIIAASASEREGLAFLRNIADAASNKRMKDVVQAFLVDSGRRFHRNLRKGRPGWKKARAAFIEAAHDSNERASATARYRWSGSTRLDLTHRPIHICDLGTLIKRYSLTNVTTKSVALPSMPGASARTARVLLAELNRKIKTESRTLGEPFSIFWATQEAVGAQCQNDPEKWRNLTGVSTLQKELFRFTFRYSIAELRAMAAANPSFGPFLCHRPGFAEGVDQPFFRLIPDQRPVDRWGRAVNFGVLADQNTTPFDGAPEVVIGEKLKMDGMGDWDHIGSLSKRYHSPIRESEFKKRFFECVLRGQSKQTVLRRIRSVL